jgi:hypothetical protein
MPITYRIDHDRRLVEAMADGLLTDRDLFGYQQEVWSRRDVAGYDEIVDMTKATIAEFVSHDRVASLAEFSAGMDASDTPSKFAIVAEADLHFGLGRMYQYVRELNPRSTKSVGVFRTRAEALDWLGRDAREMDARGETAAGGPTPTDRTG